MSQQENLNPLPGNELKAKLYSKINAIVADLGKVNADGRNEQPKYSYSYISYENVNAHLRTLLPRHQVAIVPSIVDYAERDYQGERNVTIRSIVKASFMLVDLETGYSEERLFFGASNDVGGKSFSQAATEVQKRFVLKLLHVSSKEDVDPDKTTTEVPTPKDPVEFIRAHPDLVEICKGMKLKREEIASIVINEKYDPAKVKAALESAKGF